MDYPPPTTLEPIGASFTETPISPIHIATVAIGLVQWLNWRCYAPLLNYYRLHQEALPEHAPLRRVLGALLQEANPSPQAPTPTLVGPTPAPNSLLRATIQQWRQTQHPHLSDLQGHGFILSCADVCPYMLLLSHIAFSLEITTVVHCPAWGTLVFHPRQPKI